MISSYDKKAGAIRFIIKNKKNRMVERYAKVYYDSKYDQKKLKTKSDYAILKLDRKITTKDVEPMNIKKESFMELQNEHKYSFGSLGGFSSDVGEFGALLTYDPKCKLQYYSKTYAKSTCIGFKGASEGPVVLSISNDKQNYKSNFVGVVSHYKNGKFKEIFFAPHYIYYSKVISVINMYNQ